MVVDPDDYDAVLGDIREHGEITLATRRRLARDAFAHTATYDAAIVTWFDETEPEPEPLPRTMHLALERAEILRYGENPHQQGARYRFAGAHGWWDSMVQHGGKALSYLNLYDTEAAWRLVNDFEAPACVIVKHANPCGVAIGHDIADAYVKANACDPISAFGGIVAVNRHVTLAMAEQLGDVFTEVVVAPGFDDDALAALLAKKNMRVITANAPGDWRFDLKPLDGGFIVQQPDPVSIDRVVVARGHQGRADRRPVGRPRVRVAGLCGGQQQRDRLREGPARRSASAPASRTGSTRHASRPSVRPGAPSAACARATPSSRSETASTPPPRRASRP